jgi:hypothetical protein
VGLRWLRKVAERKRGREQPGLGGEQPTGPADEYEVLRARLLAALRRHPGDTRALMRLAASLARIAAAEHRMSPRKGKDLAKSFQAVFDSLGDQILPPD